ncbi:MAG: hypothetical protein A2020_08565 [Lentisphaerae bacterium GWF2_45_14]|nr:MAG: hypothetical protein A2020_08565 [Lentisphaerae bacterium GWF2_45_14]
MLKLIILALNAGLFPLVCLADTPENPRVVSLAPSITEIIFSVGKGDLIVGRTSADTYPEKVKKATIIGGFGKPSLEALISVKPDIVFASSLCDGSVIKSIESAGIKFVMLPSESFDEYFKALDEIGRLLHCEKVASVEVARLKKGLSEFRLSARELSEDKRPLVFMEIWDVPLMTSGRKSFLNDFIILAGGRNLAGSLDKGYFNCSEEWVISGSPDIIIAPSMGKAGVSGIRSRKGWENIPAVRNSRIYTNLDQDLVFRLGPRMLEGIKIFKDCIQPVAGAK